MRGHLCKNVRACAGGSEKGSEAQSTRDAGRDASRCASKWDLLMWMGVFTLHVSNIKGKTFQFAHSRPASCVDWAWVRVVHSIFAFVSLSLSPLLLPSRVASTVKANCGVFCHGGFPIPYSLPSPFPISVSSAQNQMHRQLAWQKKMNGLRGGSPIPEQFVVHIVWCFSLWFVLLCFCCVGQHPQMWHTKSDHWSPPPRTPWVRISVNCSWIVKWAVVFTSEPFPLTVLRSWFRSCSHELEEKQGLLSRVKKAGWGFCGWWRVRLQHTSPYATLVP